MKSPLPAREDPSTPAALREGLDALAGVEPPYDVAAGAARFEARLREPPLPSGATRSTASVKLVVVVVAIGILGAMVAGSLAGGSRSRIVGSAPRPRGARRFAPAPAPAPGTGG